MNRALEELTLALLEIPSPTGCERAAADFVEARLKSVGPRSLIRAGDNLACSSGPPGRPKLLLLGHLDTVPAQGENPVRIEGDRIHGLGAADMKGGVALILELLARAVREPPRYDLHAVFYAREEGPYEGSGLPEIVAAAPESFRDVALAVALEPTGLALELGCLGTLHAEVRLHGRFAHSARPWQGRNALHMAGPLLAALADLAPREVEVDGLRFRESCSATMLSFEGARNVIPGEAAVNVNFRFGPDLSDEEAARWIEDFVDGVYGRAARDEGEIEIEITDLCPAGRVCSRNPLLAELERAAPAPVTRRAKEAWTDVGRLSRMGIDAVNLGPGDGAQAHQAGEWLSRRRLAAAWDLFCAWLWPGER